MAIATLQAHIHSALLFINGDMNKMFMAIGKTSPWENGDTPPTEDAGKDGLDEVIGYKKIDTLSLCRPLVEGETTTYQTVTYKNQTWVLIPNEEAYNENARWVYMDTEIYDNEFTLGEYRQVGLYVHLERNSGVTDNAVTPAQVSDPGILVIYRNRERQNRQDGTTVKEQIIAML